MECERTGTEPDAVLLGGFLAYQLAEWPGRGAFGLPEGGADALCAGLDGPLRESALSLLPLYLTFLFREATSEVHGLGFAADVLDTAIYALRRTDRPGPKLADQIVQWIDAMDLQAENVDHEVDGLPVPFEAWVAGAWLLERSAETFASGTTPPPPAEDAVRLALVLLRAQRRTLPWLTTVAATGGLTLGSY
jgi:hypothetical protein